MQLKRLLTLLLSHHHPDEYARCTFVSGIPICRRCLFLYLPTLVVMGVQQTSLRFDPEWAPLLAGLAIPATGEFILEQLGRLRYHPSRVAVGSVLLALPLGHGFSLYLQDPWNQWFWGLVLVFGTPSLGAVLWRAWHESRGGQGRT